MVPFDSWPLYIQANHLRRNSWIDQSTSQSPSASALPLSHFESWSFSSQPRSQRARAGWRAALTPVKCLRRSHGRMVPGCRGNEFSSHGIWLSSPGYTHLLACVSRGSHSHSLFLDISPVLHARAIQAVPQAEPFEERKGVHSLKSSLHWARRWLEEEALGQCQPTKYFKCLKRGKDKNVIQSGSSKQNKKPSFWVTGILERDITNV